MVFPPGKHPREAYRIFADPAETLLTLALAYPHVDKDLQGQMHRYVERLGLVSGERDVDPSAGAARSHYDIDPRKLSRLMDDIGRCDVARLYPVWAWILDEPAGELKRRLDIPWCRADLFYLQKLVSCIEAGGRSTWQPAESSSGRNPACLK